MVGRHSQSHGERVLVVVLGGALERGEGLVLKADGELDLGLELGQLDLQTANLVGGSLRGGVRRDGVRKGWGWGGTKSDGVRVGVG